jgi:dCTP diphosphatase
MDIKALQWELAAFVVDRGLDPLHTPKNLSMALAAEAGTLLAFFKWLADDDATALATPAQRGAAADALADSVLHAIHLADRLGIDLDEAIRHKLARNAEKYPPLAEEALAPAPVPEPAPAAAAPERRATADRRVAPDRRGSSERRFEPERRVGADRRAGADRRSPAQRGPETQARPEPPPAPVPPPAARVEPAARARAAEPPPPEPPPVARDEPPPHPARVEPPPRAKIPEPPPPPPPEPPPAARYEPPPPPEPEEEDDPYAGLDPDQARRLVEALSKQVTRARSDDPLARELHDELTTLKRSLYADNPKRAWLAGSLKSIRRILEEAKSHSVGAELRAAEHLAEVERILKE